MIRSKFITLQKSCNCCQLFFHSLEYIQRTEKKKFHSVGQIGWYVDCICMHRMQKQPFCWIKCPTKMNYSEYIFLQITAKCTHSKANIGTTFVYIVCILQAFFLATSGHLNVLWCLSALQGSKQKSFNLHEYFKVLFYKE